MSDKKQLGVRLSERGFELARSLCDHFGLGLTGLIEVVLRHEAERIGLIPGIAPAVVHATDEESQADVDDRGPLETLLDDEEEMRRADVLQRKRERSRVTRASRGMGPFELLAQQIADEENEQEITHSPVV